MAHQYAQRIGGSRGEESAGARVQTSADAEFQENILAGVSRTFALTIPQLPDGLREAVSNAYLLCRIADTIEDDPALTPVEKDRYHTDFLAALEHRLDGRTFALELQPRLAPSTLAAEVELIRECQKVLRVTHSLDPRQQRAILQCVSTMSAGMTEFERTRSPHGLANVAELERYCYFVAGVVGEMLTELFCGHSPEIEAKRGELEGRAVSFGLGLQMTNILKDVWDDHEHGTCWLPRDVFNRHGYDLHRLEPNHNGDGPAFAASMQELVGITHGHLRHALKYTLAIPNNESGIRRFLIWAALLAASTLRKISSEPLFTSGARVKVSRRTVAAIAATSSAVIRSNFGLTAIFNTAARGLPLDADASTLAETKRNES